MASTKQTDLASGGALALLGLTVAGYAYTNYALGSFSQMGPGMFPLILGVFLGLFGSAIMANALIDEETTVRLEVVPAASILGGGVMFGLLLERVGMAPAVIAAVMIASLAARSANWQRCLLLAIILAAISVVLFIWLLNLPIPAFSWSW